MSPIAAALSARVASDPQAAAHTIARQVAALRERVTRAGCVLPEAMQVLDAGYSGAT